MSPAPSATDSFPRQHARTQRFTLGRPRGAQIVAGHVLFLRSGGGEDRITDLWGFDPRSGAEEQLVSARDLLAAGDDTELPPAERARRERAREMAGGITAFATDRGGRTAAFALSGTLYSLDLGSGTVTEEQSAGAVFDPRPAPAGDRIAYCADEALHVVELGGTTRSIAAEHGVVWGRAEFIAAEEMQRSRGFWWSPDGTRVAATRVDERDVPAWHIGDPAQPAHPPQTHRYPAAGAANAEVRLAIFSLDDDRRVDVRWDRDAFPYLAAVEWGPHGPLTLLVQSRSQRTWQVLAVDPASGATTTVREDHDAAWLEIVPGVPTWLDGDRCAVVLDLADHGPQGSRAIVVGDQPVTPPGLQVRAVLDADAAEIWCTASGDDPTQVHVYRVDCATGAATAIADDDGVHAATVADGLVVRTHTSLAEPAATTVERDGVVLGSLASLAAMPAVRPDVELLTLGQRGLRAALLRPSGDGPWPLLLDPYGGPHAQRVLQARDAYLTSQWFAEQGFAVLVIDGRGTPARGPAWERAVHLDLATPVLEDQVDGLQAAAVVEPRLDLDRVAIRGWSFGGYLSALAVLRRPDVFRAAVAGAPVTDWRLYDTHYTERYLGHPDQQPGAYRVSSLVDGDGLVDPAPLPDAAAPASLLVIHGLADDNVVAAHSLRLSHALLAAGREHTFLPLSGVTHMTPQQVVAESLLLLQRDFLHHALSG